LAPAVRSFLSRPLSQGYSGQTTLPFRHPGDDECRRYQPMSGRAVAGGHTLPPHPEFLDFERTDGDAKQWPINTMEVVDSNEQVNYMKPLGPNDSSDIHWRCQIAMKVADKLGRQCASHSSFVAEDGSNCSFTAGKSYVLRSWPEGYRLFCHYKGKQSSPRQDLYLIGPTLPISF